MGAVQPETRVTVRPETWVTLSGSYEAKFRVFGVDAAEQELAEVELEAAFFDFKEADPLISERLADVVGLTCPPSLGRS